jgi:hypothetical protein
MTAKEIMDTLYPGLPQYQKDANVRWLEDQSRWVMDGGFVISPRDHWVVRKVKVGEYEIISAPGRGH